MGKFSLDLIILQLTEQKIFIGITQTKRVEFPWSTKASQLKKVPNNTKK